MNTNKGFTLVEVLVALMITSTAVISLLGMREAAIEQTARTRDSRVAWELAALAMGQVLAEEAPEWEESPPSGVEWLIPSEVRIAYATGFRVQFGAVIEEIAISQDPDAEPEKIYKITVEVFNGVDETPLRLVTHYPFGQKK